MSRKLYVLSAVLMAALALSGVVAAQSEEVQNDRFQVSVATDVDNYNVVVSNADPQSYLVMYMSPALGSWWQDFGYPVGAVTFDIFMPTSFFLGYSDVAGELDVAVPKPANLPVELQGQGWYAQALSMGYAVQPGTFPTYIFNLRTSNVARIILNEAGS